MTVVMDGMRYLSTDTEVFGHLTIVRMPIAENFRRRGKFEEIAFVFPNAPSIPITVV